MRKPLLLLLLLPLLLGQSYNVPFNPPAAAPSCTDTFSFSDDFNRASLGTTDWNVASGTWAIISSDLVRSSSTSGAAIHKTATDNRAQWACVQKDDNSGGYGGLKFRVGNTSDTGNSYAVRWNTSTHIVFRECVGSSCSDVGTQWANTFVDGDYLCADIRYQDSATEAAVWDFATTPPGARGGWGDADYCWCSGGTCAHPDCGTATKISAEPGSGNYADCSTESSCYIGFYSGAGDDVGFDNMTSGTVCE